MNSKTEYYENPQENRQYKSTLFCMVFEEKKHLLDLYNSINGTNYQNEDDLEVNTLKNAIYVSMKNDISFLIDCNMNLYEHQSTYNPNMPLRGLLYFAQLYNKYISRHKLNIYSTTLKKIPIPQYIVFYNGKENQPDRQVLLLSDAFQKSNDHKQIEGCLECRALMLNINFGHNRELMKKCKRLREYAIFVSKVRQYLEEDIEHSEQAITRALDDCIAEGILADFLSNQKAEVLELILSTFDRELYEKELKEEAAVIAEKQGDRNRLKRQIKIKLEKGKSVEKIADEVEEDIDTVLSVIQELEEN